MGSSQRPRPSRASRSQANRTGRIVAVLIGAALATEARGARGLARACAAIALGGAIGAVQLVPAWSYFQESLRARARSVGVRAVAHARARRTRVLRRETGRTRRARLRRARRRRSVRDPLRDQCVRRGRPPRVVGVWFTYDEIRVRRRRRRAPVALDRVRPMARRRAAPSPRPDLGSLPLLGEAPRALHALRGRARRARRRSDRGLAPPRRERHRGGRGGVRTRRGAAPRRPGDGSALPEGGSRRRRVAGSRAPRHRSPPRGHRARGLLRAPARLQQPPGERAVRGDRRRARTGAVVCRLSLRAPRGPRRGAGASISRVAAPRRRPRAHRSSGPGGEREETVRTGGVRAPLRRGVANGRPVVQRGIPGRRDRSVPGSQAPPVHACARRARRGVRPTADLDGVATLRGHARRRRTEHRRRFARDGESCRGRWRARLARCRARHIDLRGPIGHGRSSRATSSPSHRRKPRDTSCSTCSRAAGKSSSRVLPRAPPRPAASCRFSAMSSSYG